MYSAVSSFNTRNNAIDSAHSVTIASKGGFVYNRPHVHGKSYSFYRTGSEVKPYGNKNALSKLLIACFMEGPKYLVSRNAFVLHFNRRFKDFNINYRLLVCLSRDDVPKFIRRVFTDTTRSVNTGLIGEKLRFSIDAALNANLSFINLAQFADGKTPVLSVNRLNAIKAAANDFGLTVLQDELIISR